MGIKDEEQAKALGIRKVEGTNFIAIDMAYMPPNMSAEQYICNLKDRGIIYEID